MARGVDNEGVRARLVERAEQYGLSLASLSATIRRNPAYLQQFVARGTPRRLAERDRAVLAAALDLPESALGGPGNDRAGIAVDRLAVEASAGPGSDVDAEDRTGEAYLDPGLVRALKLRPGSVAVIRVRGTSMEPGLRDGDEVVVDTADTRPGRQARVFVVRIDGGLMIKRVAAGRAGLIVRSDNPAADPVPDGEVTVIGRAVWRMGPAL